MCVFFCQPFFCSVSQFQQKNERQKNAQIAPVRGIAWNKDSARTDHQFFPVFPVLPVVFPFTDYRE
jgi:hypothetical protein